MFTVAVASIRIDPRISRGRLAQRAALFCDPSGKPVPLASPNLTLMPAATELRLQEQLPRDGARGQHDVPQRVPDEVRVAISTREGGDGFSLAPYRY